MKSRIGDPRIDQSDGFSIPVSERFRYLLVILMRWFAGRIRLRPRCRTRIDGLLQLANQKTVDTVHQIGRPVVATFDGLGARQYLRRSICFGYRGSE